MQNAISEKRKYAKLYQAFETNSKSCSNIDDCPGVYSKRLRTIIDNNNLEGLSNDKYLAGLEAIESKTPSKQGCFFDCQKETIYRLASLDRAFSRDSNIHLHAISTLEAAKQSISSLDSELKSLHPKSHQPLHASATMARSHELGATVENIYADLDAIALWPPIAKSSNIEREKVRPLNDLRAALIANSTKTLADHEALKTTCTQGTAAVPIANKIYRDFDRSSKCRVHKNVPQRWKAKEGHFFLNAPDRRAIRQRQDYGTFFHYKRTAHSKDVPLGGTPQMLSAIGYHAHADGGSGSRKTCGTEAEIILVQYPLSCAPFVVTGFK